MDVDFDFSDVDSFFNEGEWEVEKKMIDVGDEAVKHACLLYTSPSPRD